MRALLLPGLDGTGRLFSRFVDAASPHLAAQIVKYPPDTFLDYDALEIVVDEQLPLDESYILIAESFSGPIALKVAAKSPSGLRAIVLVASFAEDPTPLRWRWLTYLPWGFIFSRTPPKSVVRRWLVGTGASAELVSDVQTANASVRGDVLAKRLAEVCKVNVTDALRECQVPMLYIEASEDRLARKGIPGDLTHHLPTLEVHSMPGPHLLLQRHPNAALNAITDFLVRHGLD